MSTQVTDFSGNVVIGANYSLYTNSIRSNGSLLIGNPSNSTRNLMTDLTIGSKNPYDETALSKINIQSKRGGTINVGNSSNGGNVNIFASNYKIQIGGGIAGQRGDVNIGSNSNGYVNNVNLVTGSSNNTLNIGSSTSKINLLGNITANSTIITPTVLSYLSGLTGNVQQQINDQLSEFEFKSDITNYYTKVDSSNIFLGKVDASNIYLKISDTSE